MMEQWLLTIITFLIGIWIGYMWGKQTTLDKTIQTLSKHISIPFKKDLKVGVVRRPTVLQVNQRNEPATMRESKEAVREALDQVPELVEHRRKLAEQERLARRN